MAHLQDRDQRTTTFSWRHPPAGMEEWLGAESHVPNLRRALRQQEHSTDDLAGTWVAGILFFAGLAVGSLVTTLLIRSRRTLS